MSKGYFFMILIPNALFTMYLAYLGKRGVPVSRFAEYKKWLRYYLDSAISILFRMLSLKG